MDLAKSSIHEYLIALDCARSLSVWMLFKYNEHQQLIELEVDPYHYNDVRAFSNALAATKLLSKATFLEIQTDPLEIAKEKWLSAEKQCERTNFEILSRGKDEKSLLRETLLAGMSYKIDKILGPFDLTEFLESGGWGPGATLRIQRRNACAINKFALEGDSTHDASDFISCAVKAVSERWQPKLSHVKGNRVAFVPKTAKTHRSIAIEPGLNLFFQKAIGQMIRRRLKVQRIDLNDQGANQRLSRLGSKFNSLATIDLSSASDTICTSVVRELFGSFNTWYIIMDLLRSKLGAIWDDTIHLYQKFSSMGNGFTFELQSLIFYVLVLQTCEDLSIATKNVSVYGDDIIVPTAAFDAVTRNLVLLGFTINKAKSYSSSYYRESCGAHWFMGVNVKPIFLRKDLSEYGSIQSFANSVRWRAHDTQLECCDRAYLLAYRTLVTHLKRFGAIYFTPYGYGDIGLISNFDEAAPSKAKNGLEGYMCRAIKPVPRQFRTDESELALVRELEIGGSKGLYGELQNSFIELASGGIKLIHHRRIRESVTPLFLGNVCFLPGISKRFPAGRPFKLLVPLWYNLGPWLSLED